MKPRTRPDRKQIESLINQGMTARDIAEREDSTISWITKVSRDIHRESQARRLEDVYRIAFEALVNNPSARNIQAVTRVLREIALLLGLNAPVNISANIDTVSKIEVVYEDMRDQLMASADNDRDDLEEYSRHLFNEDD